MQIYTKRDRERDRKRQRETERDRKRQRETERDRDRQRGKDRDRRSNLLLGYASLVETSAVVDPPHTNKYTEGSSKQQIRV